MANMNQEDLDARVHQGATELLEQQNNEAAFLNRVASPDIPPRLATALRSSQLGTNGTFALAPLTRQVVNAQVPVEYASCWRVSLSTPPRTRTVNAGAGIDETTSVDVTGMFARVTWGTAGSFAVAEVDFRQGCSFAVWGNQVSVEIVQPVAIAAPANAAQRVFGASVVYGAEGNRTDITRTINVGTLLAATSANGAVPPYAIQWRHTADFVAHADARVITMSRTLTAPVIVGDWAFVGGPETIGAWNSVPPGAVIWNYLNASANTMNQVKLEFLLAF